MKILNLQKIGLVFCFLLCLSTSIIYSQKRLKEIDSLKLELKNVSGKEKVLMYEKILKSYGFINLDSSYYYLKKMIHLSEKIKNDSLIIYSYNLRGDLLLEKFQFKESQEAYERALKINKNYIKLEAYSYNGIGNVNSKRENFELATSSFLKALTLFEKVKDSFMIIATNIHLANDFRKLKDFEASEKYNLKAIEINNGKNKFLDNFIYNNLSDLYNDMDKPNLSLKFSKKALAYFKEKNFERYIAYPYFNRAIAQKKLGEFKLSEKNFKDAIKIHLKFDNQSELANSFNGLADLYLIMGKNNEAIIASKKAIVYAEKNNLNEFQISSYKTLAKAYKNNNNLSKSLFNFSKYDSLNNAFYEANKLKITKSLNEQYQTEKKEKELLKTRTEKAETELALSKTKIWIFLLVGSLAILLFMAIAIFQRNKRKHQLAIANQKEKNLEAILFAEEKERSRIARELHDGVVQQIGSVILKTRTLFSKLRITENDESQNVLETLENSNKDIRNISHQMMPRALSELGLISAIDDLLKGSLDYANINYSFEHFNLKERLSEKIEITLYRITQELINNIIKHSKATSVSIQLINSDENILLLIEDDGVGIDVSKTKKGIGFNNIKSRLAMINGEANFDKSPEKGTLVTVKIKK